MGEEGAVEGEGAEEEAAGAEEAVAAVPAEAGECRVVVVAEVEAPAAAPPVSSPRPSARPSPGGGRPGGGRPGGPQLGGGRPSTLPSRPQVGGRPGGPGSGPGNRPGGIGGIGNRPGIDNRPGDQAAGNTRHVNRPGGIGGVGNRPGGIGGAGNRPGIDNRPGGIGGVGNRPGIDNRPGGIGGIGNRPGIDNRPGGIGGIGNRPGIDNRPGGIGGIGNRPGIDNRPGGIGGVGNRPGIDNRPGIGGGNTINRGDVNVGGIRENNVAGIGVDPGYGVRPPAYNNWRGAYWGYHQGWANGYWHGYHNNNAWGWGQFATGTALGVTAWALGSSFYNWGYASYANPYYAEAPMAQPIVIEQTVVGAEPQTVTVPGYTYDYSQPIDTQSAPPPAEVADPAVAKFESARAAFGSGDYAGALQLTDEALKVLPNDATLHEFRALVLFAVEKYDLAAGTLYAVLSVGPGWDWTTMAGLYSNIDIYTSQLRKLEAFVTANPKSTAGRFVLAYHYLTQGNTDEAVGQFKEVVALSPQDTLSAQLVRQFSKPGAQPDSQAASPPPAATAVQVKRGDLLGKWTARPSDSTTIRLTIADEGTFTWTVDAKGKTQRLAGKWSLGDDMLTLADDGRGGVLVGRVNWQSPDRWGFRLLGTGPEEPGLTFTR